MMILFLYTDCCSWTALVTTLCMCWRVVLGKCAGTSLLRTSSSTQHSAQYATYGTCYISLYPIHSHQQLSLHYLPLSPGCINISPSEADNEQAVYQSWWRGLLAPVQLCIEADHGNQLSLLVWPTKLSFPNWVQGIKINISQFICNLFVLDVYL